MPKATKPCARAELVLKGMGATTTEPVAATTDGCASRAGTPQQGMPPQPEARTLPGQSSLRSLQRGKSLSSDEDPPQSIINKCDYKQK